MEVIEGWLVVEVHAQLVGINAVALGDCVLRRLAQVSQQIKMASVQIPQRFDVMLVNNAQQVEGFNIATVPFEVGQQYKSSLRIRVLKHDTFLLLLVLEYVIDPLKGKLAGGEIWKRYPLVQIRGLPNEVLLAYGIFFDVLLGGGINDSALNTCDVEDCYNYFTLIVWFVS